MCIGFNLFRNKVTVKFSVKLKCELKREEKEKKIEKNPSNFSDLYFLQYCCEIGTKLEIVGEWVMKRQPFWIKILHISPILLGRFGDKKEWKLLSVLCSLWGIYARGNLQCVFSLQTLRCTMFLFSYKLA